MDNIYGDQHEICAINGLGHTSEQEIGVGPDRQTVDCFVIGPNKREFYSLSWEEIEEAANKDELLVKLKSALQAGKEAELTELLKGKLIHCTESEGGRSAIKMEDLSLYRNVIMVRDRIWAPKDITFAFFNNLHLGHRSVDMMQRLALRSVYWTGMSKDLTSFFNECQSCNRLMDKNKKLDDLPEDETTRAFECISMDGFHTPAGENGLAIIDRHTGYIWAEKTGDTKTGTADVVWSILIRLLGPGIYHVKRFKMDNGNL